MPAWPGGPCPACGEDMPEKMVHCRNCRTLLNPELESDSVEIPPFVPLRELETMLDVAPAGYYVACPACGRELRVRAHYTGQKVQCKFCEAPFLLDPHHGAALPHAFFADCPYCNEELRVAWKYRGQKVACKHCSGHIHFTEE